MPFLNGTTPDYGRRLVPNIIDDTAASDPGRLFASIPLTHDLQDGYLDISYGTVANAINRASWWLSENMGLASTSEVFSYTGPNDLRYPIFLVAAMKCGYQMMLPSPRNSKDYQIQLLRYAGCKTVFCARSHTRHLEELEGEENLDLFCAVVPELSEILDVSPQPRYPFDKSYDDIKKKKFMILHTSGSTGPPKPISFTIESTTTEDAHQSLDDPSRKLWWRLFANRSYFLGMPCFHSAGIFFALFKPVYYGSVVVYGPSARPLTSDVAAAALASGKFSGAFLPPSILEDLAKSPANLAKLQSLDFVAYGGGALSETIGNQIAQVTTLHNFIGFTEASAPPRFVMDPEDWNYFEFHPASGFTPKHHHDDLYEITFVRNAKYESIQSCFRIMPELKEYSTGDLISRHPSKSNLWAHRGRADDLVVLSNGEKFNPIPAEQVMKRCSYVQDVIVHGEGRFQASVLVEKNPETAADVPDDEIIAALWPFVEAANKISSAQSRVIKSLILVAPAEKPFSRSAKGTLQRKPTIGNFKTELDALYSGPSTVVAAKPIGKKVVTAPVKKADMQTKTRLSPRKTSPSPKTNGNVPLTNGHKPLKPRESISIQSIRDQVAAICGMRPPTDAKDLFELGMDSVKATELAGCLRELSKAWPQDQESAVKLIYDNPSISAIAKALQLRAEAAENRSAPIKHTAKTAKQPIAQKPLPGKVVESPASNAYGIEDAIGRHTTDLSHLLATRAKTVILTGSTGSLGCYLLDSLMRDPSIGKVICLHRGDNGLQRQRAASEMRGLHFDCAEKSVDFLRADFSRSDLGLTKDQLTTLLTTADAIIHNAWTVDFNQSLSSFDGHLAGVRHLAELAAYSQRRPRFVFVSSVGSVMNWDARRGDVPEVVHADSSVAGGNGYSQSKHAAERILHKMAESSDLAVSIVRVGQIAGPVSSPGSWSASDWLPMLVSTSRALGVLPKSLGAGDSIDWVPIDVVAQSFTDLLRQELTNRVGSQCQVYHIANPRKTSWSALLPATCQMLGPQVKLVPFHEWVQRLQKQGGLQYAVKQYPALKILPFYKSMVAPAGSRMAALSTARMRAVSPTLANLDPVQGVWMERWIQSWIQ